MVERFAGARLWVVGDVMLDEYVQGEVGRISPEAPVPVVAVEQTWTRLGGAANVANCLATLGADVLLCGVIGADAAGEVLVAACGEAGIDTCALMRLEGRPTARKVRVVARHQQLLRMDWERPEPVSDALLDELLATLGSAPPPEAILLSDYGKGMLTDAALARFFALGRELGVPVLVDPKRTDLSAYAGATVVTPNQREFTAMVGGSLPPVDSEAFGALAMAQRSGAGVGSLVVTLGERGLLVVPEHGEVHPIEATSRDVYDVTGAGDTLIAVLALALATGVDLVEAARVANAAAGVVVAKFGTACVTPSELLGALGSSRTVLGGSQLQSQLANWRAQGRKVVFTNGCFDLLHTGHLSILRFAASQGDALVVGLNDDASVRRLKGADRPVMSQDDRAALVAALDCVDAVALFSEDTPLALITEVQPDVLVKGADYRVEDVVGREVVEARGGRVVLAPLVPNRSSTRLRGKLQGE